MLKLLHEVGRSVTILHDNALLLVYRYGAGWPKPHFHPLYAPGGTRVLTRHAPHHYVHHRGLMWSFGRVAPRARPDEWVNFWEERVRERDAEGRVLWPHPLDDARRGVIRHVAFETIEPGHKRALLVAEHEWRRAADDLLLLRQRQRVTVYPATEEGWFFDLEFEMRAAGEPLLLYPLPADEAAFYKSAPYGLACQFSREMEDGVVLNSRGECGAECCEQPAAWCDYSSPLDDDETHRQKHPGWVGLAIMNHPDNPLHPTPFLALVENIAFLAATPTQREPLLISNETPRTFRFRVFAHHGRGEMSTLQRHYQAFAGQTAC